LLMSGTHATRKQQPDLVWGFELCKTGLVLNWRESKYTSRNHIAGEGISAAQLPGEIILSYFPAITCGQGLILTFVIR
jgi:hypothetical protein